MNQQQNHGAERGDEPPANNRAAGDPPTNNGAEGGGRRNPQPPLLRELLLDRRFADARMLMANDMFAVILADTHQPICLLHEVSDIPDFPLDIVVHIIYQGGANPVLTRRNAVFGETPLMHMVRTGTSNRRKTQIIERVLSVSPHDVYSMDFTRRSALDIFANRWMYEVDGRDDDDWDQGGNLRLEFQEAMRDGGTVGANLEALKERYAVLLKASTAVLSLPLNEQPPVPLHVHGMAASRPLRSSVIMNGPLVFPSRPVVRGDIPPILDCMLLNAATSKCFVPLSAFRLFVRLAHPDDGARRNACGQVPLHALLINSTYWQQPQQLPPFVEALVARFPGTARFRDNDDRMVLHTAIDLGFHWNDPTTQAIVNDYPEALGVRDPRTFLFPFMMAAMGADLNTAYWLLREHPEVMRQIVAGGGAAARMPPAPPGEQHDAAGGATGQQPQLPGNQGA